MSQSRSLLFQFSVLPTSKSNAAVLLGIRHNSTGQISYRLVLIDFDATLLNTSMDRHSSDELRLWLPASPSPAHRNSKSSLILLEDNKNTDQIILTIFIVILSLICFTLIFIIISLCYQRQKQQKQTGSITTTTVSAIKSPLPTSSPMVEQFHTPDLTTKVTLLTHFHLNDLDFGTDV